MATYDELLELRWPSEFIVEYIDGTQERLLRGDSVGLVPPTDDPEGIGSFEALLPKKHPRIRSQYLRYVRFTELRAILTVDGRTLWPR